MFRVLRFALSFAAISALSPAQSTIPQGQAKASATVPPAVSPATAVASSPHRNPTPLPVALPENLLGEGRVFYRQGNFEAAIASYERYVQQHPQLPDGYAGLVRVYLKQKNVELAAQTLRLVILTSKHGVLLLAGDLPQPPAFG